MMIGKVITFVMMETTMKDVNGMEEIVVMITLIWITVQLVNVSIPMKMFLERSKVLMKTGERSFSGIEEKTSRHWDGFNLALASYSTHPYLVFKA